MKAQKKCLVLNGSPKTISDTMQLTGAFLKGLNAEEEYEIHIIDVIHCRIEPCRGCLSCLKSELPRCVIDDDMTGILAEIRTADVLIWSFPLYCYSMPSPLKAVLDRTLLLSRLRMIEENGRVRHEGKSDRTGQRILVISGCGFPDWKGNFDALRIMCRNCFGASARVICVPETPMMNVPEAAAVADPLRERFTEAGKEYARTGALSDETAQELEKPMIPSGQYIAIVNGTT